MPRETEKKRNLTDNNLDESENMLGEEECLLGDYNLREKPLVERIAIE